MHNNIFELSQELGHVYFSVDVALYWLVVFFNTILCYIQLFDLFWEEAYTKILILAYFF